MGCIGTTRVRDAADASSTQGEDGQRVARSNIVLLIGILFLVLLAFAMRIDRRKHMDVGGFAVVEVLMFAVVISIVVAGAFLLGGSALSLAR